MGDALTIRPARPADAGAIAAIYAHYVRHSVITFETEAPGPADMEQRIAEILPRYPCLVAEDKNGVAGYAYATALYARAAYRWAAESTVYVGQGHLRRGIGRALYHALIDALAIQGIQAVVGKITLPNPASVALHEAFGFRHCGTFPKIGFKHGGWHDVGLYQLDLGERPAFPVELRPPS